MKQVTSQIYYWRMVVGVNESTELWWPGPHRFKCLLPQKGVLLALDWPLVTLSTLPWADKAAPGRKAEQGLWRIRRFPDYKS